MILWRTDGNYAKQISYYLVKYKGFMGTDVHIMYGENTLKILFPGTTGPILMKLCMKYQRPKPFIICANYDPGLTLTYFTTMSNLQNVTLMDILEFIASCDLEFD